MFEKNILTFNPGWDQSGNGLDPFTVMPRRRIRTFRQAIEHTNRTLRFGFGASQIAERCRQMLLLLIPISEHQVTIAFLEVVTTSDFANIRSHQRCVQNQSFPKISHRECDLALLQNAKGRVAHRHYIAKKDNVGPRVGRCHSLLEIVWKGHTHARFRCLRRAQKNQDQNRAQPTLAYYGVLHVYSSQSNARLSFSASVHEKVPVRN
jgi:hypothetical protein